MKTVMLMISVLSLIGCGSGSGTSTKNAVIPPGSNLLNPMTVSLTYYSKTQLFTPNVGQPAATYTATASCVQYLGTTYCWDDGIHAASITGLLYSYWGVDSFNMAVTHNYDFGCNGGCVAPDPMTATPSIITPSMALDIIGGSAAVNTVFSTGVPTNVNCTVNGSTLNCVNFSINLAQTALNL